MLVLLFLNICSQLGIKITARQSEETVNFSSPCRMLKIFMILSLGGFPQSSLYKYMLFVGKFMFLVTPKTLESRRPCLSKRESELVERQELKFYLKLIKALLNSLNKIQESIYCIIIYIAFG